MGATCAKCRKVTIDVIPDKDVMLAIVERIAAFEEMLKAGESLTPAQAKEKKSLEPAARALKRAQTKISDQAE